LEGESQKESASRKPGVAGRKTTLGGNSMQQKIELQTIQNGAVLDLFGEEFKKVLANIEDENTAANSERSITIKVAIKPDKTRRTGEIKVQVSSTLAKIKPAESFLFFDKDADGKFSAYSDDPGPELPGISENPNIKQFKPAVNEG
jgi:hypothetical protein